MFSSSDAVNHPSRQVRNDERQNAYVDHFQDPITEEGRKDFEVVEQQKKRRLSSTPELEDDPGSRSRKKAAPEQFPLTLYRMLEEASESGYDEVVCWKGHGRAFCVNNREKFVRDVMPGFFWTTKFASFKRQLSWYKFQRIRKGPDRDAFYHEYFLRGRPDLTAYITRLKTPLMEELPPTSKRRPRKMPSVATVMNPDFDELPKCSKLADEDIERLCNDAARLRHHNQQQHQQQQQFVPAPFSDIGGGGGIGSNNPWPQPYAGSVLFDCVESGSERIMGNNTNNSASLYSNSGSSNSMMGFSEQIEAAAITSASALTTTHDETDFMRQMCEPIRRLPFTSDETYVAMMGRNNFDGTYSL